MMKGKKIAMRNKLAIFCSESNGYSVYAPDGTCLSSGYYNFATAERYCLNNTMFTQNKKDNNKPKSRNDDWER